MTFRMKFLKRIETLSNISIRKEGNEYHLINPFLHNAKGYVSFISNQTIQNVLLITNIQWMGTNVPFSQQVDSNISQSTTPTKPPVSISIKEKVTSDSKVNQQKSNTLNVVVIENN